MNEATSSQCSLATSDCSAWPVAYVKWFNTRLVPGAPTRKLSSSTSRSASRGASCSAMCNTSCSALRAAPRAAHFVQHLVQRSLLRTTRSILGDGMAHGWGHAQQPQNSALGYGGVLCSCSWPSPCGLDVVTSSFILGFDPQGLNPERTKAARASSLQVLRMQLAPRPRCVGPGVRAGGKGDNCSSPAMHGAGGKGQG